MELLKKNIRMNRLKCKSNLQITLDDDFNVPDTKPDIEKIIKEQGIITIQEITPVNDRFLVKGSLDFNFLYTSQETDRPVHNMSGRLPFEETVNMENACGEDAVGAKWELDDMSAALINSRKISVKAIVSLLFAVEDISDEEVAVSVDGDETIQYQDKSLKLTQIALSKKDTYRIKDEVALPFGKDNIHELLYSDITLQEVETRVLDQKISLKGVLHIFILYAGESEGRGIQCFDTELPVSGMLDCSGCSEDMVSDIEVSVYSKDIQIKPDDDGEERILDLEIVLNLDIKAYEEEDMDILSDLYSIKNQMNITWKDVAYRDLLVKNNSKLRVVESVKLEEGQPRVLQICNGSAVVKIDEEEVMENGVQVDGVVEVQILYITEDDRQPLGAVRGTIPFSQLVEVKGMKDNSTYELKASIDQLGLLLVDSGEIEVKATMNLDIIVFDEIVQKVIQDAQETGSLDEVRKDMPGIVGYVVKEGDTMWKIAKEFYTTVDVMKELNEIENGLVEPGDKLLITKSSLL